MHSVPFSVSTHTLPEMSLLHVSGVQFWAAAMVAKAKSGKNRNASLARTIAYLCKTIVQRAG